jgi:hypothetical protein
MKPRTTTMGVRVSLAHLAPAEQTTPGSSGRPRKPYEAVCGARMKTRTGTVEYPDLVERDVQFGHRKWCPRCLKTLNA